MNESMKIAGRNDTGVVTPINVSNEGHVREERFFQCNYGFIIDTNITPVTWEEAVYCNAYDVHNAGMIAIIVRNSSGTPLTLYFHDIVTDQHASSTTPIYNAKGEAISVEIPNNRIIAITP